MDWSKAKTILIVSFIIVNIILVYNLIIENDDVDSIVDEKFAQDVVELLKNKDIKLETEIPREAEGLPTLLVQYEDLNIFDINKEYFKGKGEITSKGDSLSILEVEDEKITIVNKKLIIYESQARKKEYKINNIEEASGLVLKSLEERGYDISDLKLSYSKKIDDDYYLEYSKMYNGRYLESAFTNVHINNGGIIKLERLWMNVREEAKTPIYIANAHKSILELLSMNRAYNKTITDISLSYYFDPDRHEYIENPEMTKQGRAIPAWRIQFDDGYKIFLDNY